MAIEGGPAPQRTMTVEELGREAGATAAYVQRLLDAGAIRPNSDGSFDVGNIQRVRLAQALSDGGIDLGDLMEVMRGGPIVLDWVARLWTVAHPSGRTFAEFAASMGEHEAELPTIYGAFGLAVPPPDMVMREDEERAIAAFVEVWSMVDDRPETFVRAARIAGEGVRRLQIATQDLFDELGGPPASQANLGKSPDVALRPSIALTSNIAPLLLWLQSRHQENEIFSRIVGFVEDILARQRSTAPGEAQAIAFVDLSGYTELTVEAGDERAAEYATSLQALAESATRAHRGRVVKLLGDGVMLRYPSIHDAVRSVRDLMTAIADAGLPAAHAGIAAGPLVIRDGDVYGHTVNLAARIAGQAAPGAILVAHDQTDRLDEAGIGWADAGEAGLKGIATNVRLARITDEPE